VTLVPEQIVFPGFAVMITLAVTVGLTVIVITFDVAGLPVTQFAFEVSIHEIRFPFVKPVVVYVALFVPTFVAPFFH
jgi:hypothetical protein